MLQGMKELEVHYQYAVRQKQQKRCVGTLKSLKLMKITEIFYVDHYGVVA